VLNGCQTALEQDRWNKPIYSYWIAGDMLKGGELEAKSPIIKGVDKFVRVI